MVASAAMQRPRSNSRTRVAIVALFALAVAHLGCSRFRRRAAAPTSASAAVPTARHPVVHTYHGESVTDPYEWLENANDPAVRSWVAAQNARTRSVLDRIPGRDALERELTNLLSAQSVNFISAQSRGGRWFVLRTRPGAQQAYIVSLASPNDRASERVIVDPNTIDPAGRTSIEWFAPSRDGQRIAVALGRDGSEVGALHFFDATTGRELGDVIERVNVPTGGGSVEWNGDGTGVYYTRYPRTGERPAADLDFFQQVYFHPLGRPDSEDRYEIGREFPRIGETSLRASVDHRWILATTANGDGGEFAHYLHGPDGAWTQITHFSDAITHAVFGPDDALYLLSHLNAPRGRILRMPLATPLLSAAVQIVPESETVIQQIVPTETRLYVVDLAGGPSTVRIFDHAGAPQGRLPVPEISSVRSMFRTTGDEVAYRAETYLTPPAWYRASPALAQPTPTALRDEAPARYDDAEVVRETATSRDGTQVPVMVIRRRGTTLDGSNPTLLGGYGGYGVSMVPSYSTTNRVWLDRGGVVAIAILRGGGEFGEAWHRAGNLTNKQNVFDDFIAAAERLIALRYTTPALLAIRGRSNGGLLMGAALTQRPELFRAVYSGVGIYDMLRVELDPNGAFNTTEFGSVRDPAQFRALYTYSPFHRVHPGGVYPAVLLTTGDHDGRVNPSHSRKMTAQLQFSTHSGRPVLLRTTARAGHGMGTSRVELIAEQTDVWSFLLWQLGIPLRARH